MLDKIMMYLGYGIVISLGLCLSGFLFYLAYIIYDYWLKKWLGWKERELRRDLFYFIKHKKEIREYIKQREVKNYGN